LVSAVCGGGCLCVLPLMLSGLLLRVALAWLQQVPHQPITARLVHYDLKLDNILEHWGQGAQTGRGAE